jgi:hypothetical protein
VIWAALSSVSAKYFMLTSWRTPDGHRAQRPAGVHIAQARAHLDALARGERSEPHLSRAIIRLLMALSKEGYEL